MDGPSDWTQWAPSLDPAQRTLDWDDTTVKYLLGELAVATREIKNYPYDPARWVERAQVLESLGYPELVAGDAHKGKILAELHLDFPSPKSGTFSDDSTLLGRNMGFRITCTDEKDEERFEVLIPGLSESQKNATGRWQRSIEATSEEAARLQNLNLYYLPEFMEGSFIRRLYPWTAASYCARSDDLLLRIQTELLNNRAVDGHRGPTCKIGRDALGTGNSDLLGIFALRDIKKGEWLVEDTSDTFGCNGPRGRHHQFSHTKAECRDPIHPNTPKDDVHHDLRWIRESAWHAASNPLLLSRFLLRSVSDAPDIHPLDFHLIARMTACFDREPHSFSLRNDIDIPNTVLADFGIDIFADHRYDTWVLFTIRARIDNNSWSSATSATVSPLFSMFNHSCEPNVSWTSVPDYQTVNMVSVKDVREGEQLFIEYDQYLGDKPLEERRRRLARWLCGDCQCTKCVRDEAEVQNAAGWDLEIHPVLPEQRGVEVAG